MSECVWRGSGGRDRGQEGSWGGEEASDTGRAATTPCIGRDAGGRKPGREPKERRDAEAGRGGRDVARGGDGEAGMESGGGGRRPEGRRRPEGDIGGRDTPDGRGGARRGGATVRRRGGWSSRGGRTIAGGGGRRSGGARSSHHPRGDVGRRGGSIRAPRSRRARPLGVKPVTDLRRLTSGASMARTLSSRRRWRCSPLNVAPRKAIEHSYAGSGPMTPRARG